MNIQDLVAIDIHTHAEVSCWNPFDNYGEEYDRAADKYFRSNRRPSIAETIAYYRERKIGLVMFTVDSESQLGRRRIPNEEIAQAARENADMMMCFASIDHLVACAFAQTVGCATIGLVCGFDFCVDLAFSHAAASHTQLFGCTGLLASYLWGTLGLERLLALRQGFTNDLGPFFQRGFVLRRLLAKLDSLGCVHVRN